MKSIKVCVRREYGKERIYPVTYSTELEILTGQKTLNRSHMQALEHLGFSFFLDLVPNVRQAIL